MRRKNGKTKKKFPLIKKELKDFLLSEEGKISQKDIAKLGISLAILAMMLEPQTAEAKGKGHSSHSKGHSSHSNVHSSHSNAPSHKSHLDAHSSHSSHSSALFSTGQGGHNSSTGAHKNTHSNAYYK